VLLGQMSLVGRGRLARSVRVAKHGTFLVRIAARGRTSLRARVATETSLTWTAGR